MADSEKHKSHLTMGWQVTDAGDPQYWLYGKPVKTGAQSKNDLVQIPADRIASHTAIIAQSGSGKSFFLGRLIEEVLLNTKSRCIILDPNADFLRVNEVQGASLWENAAYDARRGLGKLPHEATQEEFKEPWSRISIKIRSRSGTKGQNFEPLRIWWPSISPAFLAEDVEEMQRSELYHCHSFVRALAALFSTSKNKGKSKDLIDEAQRLFRLARQISEADFRVVLERQFELDDLSAAKLTGGKWESRLIHQLSVGAWLVPDMTERMGSIDLAITTPKYVSQSVERFYFAKAQEYKAEGILGSAAERSSRSRLEVIDIPSFGDKGIWLLAINSILTTEWIQARAAWNKALNEAPDQDKRIPTFIVVDEAHNLIPAKSRSKAEDALRDQFRTIVAEGRKYGLFVILVSQRPDKLDPQVLSECENKAVMRLNSNSVLEITRQMLGLDDVPRKLLDKCLDFKTGRALLIGNWAREGQLIYCAARRTVEGGRNLREEFWAVAEEQVDQTEKSVQSNDNGPDQQPGESKPKS